MFKKVIKEIFILLLLIVVVALLLAVAFYDYVPINKVVPEPVTYSMPTELTEIKEELENTVVDTSEEAILTYEIDEKDLSGYKQTKNYDAGKANPFEVYVEEPKESTENTNQIEKNKGENTSGTLFENKNTK